MRSMGLCQNHYLQYRYHNFPEIKERLKEYAKKYWGNYRKRKLAEDPDYFRRKGREYARANRKRIEYNVAKNILKKMSPEKRNKLIYEIQTIDK